MTSPLARFLHPDGTARTRDGRVVEKLVAYIAANRITGYIEDCLQSWGQDGTAAGGFREFDLIPAFTRPFTITGRAFTAELWQTGEGDTARTHLRCTAIDERARGKKLGRTIFSASNGWFVGSFVGVDLQEVNHRNPIVWLRGSDEEDPPTSAPGHHACAAAVALAEALAAWDKELEGEDAMEDELHSKKHGCNGCGLAYGGPGWCDVIVPDEVWDEIHERSPGGILCFNCIAARCERRGLRGVPVSIRSGPFAADETDPAGYFLCESGVWRTGRRSGARPSDAAMTEQPAPLDDYGTAQLLAEVMRRIGGGA